MPKFCTQCGFKLIPEDKFCGDCGKVVVVETTGPAIPPRPSPGNNPPPVAPRPVTRPTPRGSLPETNPGPAIPARPSPGNNPPPVAPRPVFGTPPVSNSPPRPVVSGPPIVRPKPDPVPRPGESPPGPAIPARPSPVTVPKPIVKDSTPPPVAPRPMVSGPPPIRPAINKGPAPVPRPDPTPVTKPEPISRPEIKPILPRTVSESVVTKAPVPIKNIPPPPVPVPPPSDELPPNWEEYFTDDGTPYYYNTVTTETVWDKPKRTSVTPNDGGDGLRSFVRRKSESKVGGGVDYKTLVAEKEMERKTKENNALIGSPQPATIWQANKPEPAEVDPKQKEEEEAKKKEEAKKRSERQKKEQEAEESYVKNKLGNKQVNDFHQRKRQMSILAKTIDAATCDCTMRVTQFEIKMKEGKPDFVAYKLEVMYDCYSWTVFRRYKQFEGVDLVLRRHTKGYNQVLPPAKQNKKQKFDPTFLEARRQGLDVYLQNLVPIRPNIFGTKYTSGTFVKFISPTQYGDEKPADFIMPFKIEDYL